MDECCERFPHCDHGPLIDRLWGQYDEAAYFYGAGRDGEGMYEREMGALRQRITAELSSVSPQTRRDDLLQAQELVTAQAKRDG